jgi:hypothetical protein
LRYLHLSIRHQPPLARLAEQLVAGLQELVPPQLQGQVLILGLLLLPLDLAMLKLLLP